MENYAPYMFVLGQGHQKQFRMQGRQLLLNLSISTSTIRVTHPAKSLHFAVHKLNITRGRKAKKLSRIVCILFSDIQTYQNKIYNSIVVLERKRNVLMNF